MDVEAPTAAGGADSAPLVRRTECGRPRRILLVVRHPVGGIRTFLRYVYGRFDPARFRCVLVAPDLPETRVLLDDLHGLAVEFVPTAPKVGAPAFCAAVLSASRARRIDLIHSQGFTSAVCSVPAATLQRLPHVVTCHDVLHETQFAGWRGRLRRAALQRALAGASRIHCVSSDSRDNLLERLPTLRARRPPVVVANGIETQRFLRASARDLRAELGLPVDTFLIGFFGRFMGQKGFRYLVDALALLVRDTSLPARPLVLAVGERDGFVREEQARVERLGLARSVFFLPFVADIASTIKGLDVVAMPSLWEACGLVAMETMVAGVPLIGTSCVGLREVLRDTPAVPVEPRNAFALRDALRRELCQSTKAAARSFSTIAANRFDARPPADALERLLLEATGDPAAFPAPA